MDAPRLDAPATDDSGADANENVMTFDAIVLPEDAANTAMDALDPVADATDSPDDGGGVTPRDAIVVGPEPDATTSSMDAFVSTDAPEVGLGARDGGADARFVGDAGRCTVTTDCPVATLAIAPGLVACQDTSCLAMSCVPSGAAFDCPPAGMCVRNCQRDRETGLPICTREGMRCAGLGDACDLDAQCTAGNVCEVLSGCAPGVCVPGCGPSMAGTTMTLTLPRLGTVSATCNGHGYVPVGVSLPWCAIGLP